MKIFFIITTLFLSLANFNTTIAVANEDLKENIETQAEEQVSIESNEENQGTSQNNYQEEISTNTVTDENEEKSINDTVELKTATDENKNEEFNSEQTNENKAFNKEPIELTTDVSENESLKPAAEIVEKTATNVEAEDLSIKLNNHKPHKTTANKETNNDTLFKKSSSNLQNIKKATPKTLIKTKSENKSTNKLRNLNPNINKWFLLELNDPQRKVIHIENVFMFNSLYLIDEGIVIVNKPTGKRKICRLFDSKTFDIRTLNPDSFSNPYYPLCDGLIYARFKKESETRLSLTEWATEKLRTMSFGENIINFVKPLIVSSHAEAATQRILSFLTTENSLNNILDAKTSSSARNMLESSTISLGISLENNEKILQYGKWYKTKMHDGIHVSLMIPELIDTKIINSFTKPIDPKEQDKLVYLTAYDLSNYSINFVHGTVYPGLQSANNTDLNSIALSGSVPPYMINKTVGVFIGGYKRSHATFKYGEHKGKNFGYIENGVVLNKMESELATIYSTIDGDVNIIKWPNDKNEEDSLLKNIVSARQNGVMIVDNFNPGKHIYNWGHGNWSGDVNGNFRTLRSAICIQNNSGKKHLIFAAFTSATPATMAKTLQSYNCQNAMQLDMNAYMYLHNAIFKFDKNSNINIEYLHTEMEFPKGLKRHRFIMDNNNRDFFYVFSKDKI